MLRLFWTIIFENAFFKIIQKLSNLINFWDKKQNIFKVMLVKK